VPEAYEVPEASEVPGAPELPEPTLQSLAFEEHPEPPEGQAPIFGRTGVLPCRTVQFLLVSCRSCRPRSQYLQMSHVVPL
jgi:hypothetical protein